jgi:hypothetical protein
LSIWLLWFLVYGYVNREGTPVHFVVQNGFKGPIRLPLDPIDGKDVVPTNGQFVYVIPADGLLRVKSFEPFRRWHKETASYENGSAIPSENQTWIGIVFFGGGENGQGMWWFVGTKTEYEHWQPSDSPDLWTAPKE